MAEKITENANSQFSLSFTWVFASQLFTPQPTANKNSDFFFLSLLLDFLDDYISPFEKVGRQNRIIIQIKN